MILKNTVGEIYDNEIKINTTTIKICSIKTVEFYRFSDGKREFYLTLLSLICFVLSVFFYFPFLLIMGIIFFAVSKINFHTDFYIVIGVNNKYELVKEMLRKCNSIEVKIFTDKLLELKKQC